MRTKLTLVAVAALIAVALLIVLRLDRPSMKDESTGGASAAPDERAAVEAASLAAVTDQGARSSRAAASTPGDAPPDVLPDAGAAPTDPSVDAGPDWRLQLDVAGPEHPTPVRLTIRAQAEGNPFAADAMVTVECRTGERVEERLNALLSGSTALRGLNFEAEHPELRVDAFFHPLPDGTGTSGVPTESVIVELNVAYAPRVTGRTVREDGSGFAADVGAWPLAGDSVGDAIAARTQSSDDGRFELVLPEQGSYLIAAADGDRLPGWGRAVVHVTAEPTDLGDLVLPLGAVFSGRFECGGKPPPGKVSFTLRRAEPSKVLQWDDWETGHSAGTIYWTGAGVERSSSDRVASENGTFRVNGLHPGVWTMDLHGYDVDHARFERRPREILIPALGHVVNLDWSRIAVQLVPEDVDHLPSEAVLVLDRPGRDPERMNLMESEIRGDDARAFVFREGEAVSFTLVLTGRDGDRRDVTTPFAGERMRLEFAVPAVDRSAGLVLELSGDVPAEGTEFQVHVAPNAGGEALAPTSQTKPRKVALAGGKLAIDELAPGPVRVLAYPSSWDGQRATMHLDARCQTVLRSGEEATVAMKLAQGGRVEVEARAADGTLREGSCAIYDSGGRELDVMFVGYAPDGGGGVLSPSWISKLAPSIVVPNLPPGEYQVQMESERRTVRVTKGKTSRVIIK